MQNTPSDDGESGLLSIVDSPALNTTQHEPDSANTRTTGRNKSTVAKTPNKTKPRQNRFKTPESTVPASRLPEIISLLDDWENDDSPYSTPGHDPKLLAPSQQTSRASTKKRSMEIPRNSEGGGTQIGPSLSKDDYEEKFLNSFLDGPSFPNSSKMLADINNSSKRAQIQGHRRTMTRTDSQVTTRPEDDCQFITPTPAPRQIRKFQNLQQAGEDSDHLTDYPAQNNGRIIPHVVEGTIPVPMPNLPPELPASMPISGEQHLSMALTHLTSEKKVVERKLLASTTELQARKAELGSLISTNQNLKVELEKYKGAVPSLKSQIQELKQVIAGINSNCTSLDETALAIQEELKECSHERLIIRREIQQERYALGIIERKLLDYKEPTAILKELEMEKDNGTISSPWYLAGILRLTMCSVKHDRPSSDSTFRLRWGTRTSER